MADLPSLAEEHVLIDSVLERRPSAAPGFANVQYHRILDPLAL
jgi:hypothetical protein